MSTINSTPLVVGRTLRILANEILLLAESVGADPLTPEQREGIQIDLAEILQSIKRCGDELIDGCDHPLPLPGCGGGRPDYALPEIAVLGRATVNGIPVKTLELFEETGYWRWRIVAINGREYVDGGNFISRIDAGRSLIASLDPVDFEGGKSS